MTQFSNDVGNICGGPKNNLWSLLGVFLVSG